MKKTDIIKFLFPFPTIIITILMFIGACGAYSSKIIKSIPELILSLLFCFALYMIPLDVIIWILKKILKYIKHIQSTPQLNHYSNKHINCNNSTKRPIEKKYDDDAIEKIQKMQREYELTQLKEKHEHNIELLESNTEILQDIGVKILEIYRSFGIYILISRAEIRVNEVVYMIVPHSGTSLRSILNLKDDISVRLGVQIEMEKSFSLGAVGVIIPIEYFENLKEEQHE